MGSFVGGRDGGGLWRWFACDVETERAAVGVCLYSELEEVLIDLLLWYSSKEASNVALTSCFGSDQRLYPNFDSIVSLREPEMAKASCDWSLCQQEKASRFLIGYFTARLDSHGDGNLPPLPPKKSNLVLNALR